MKILIRRGRVMDPETGYDETADVLIEDEMVQSIGTVEADESIDQIIDAAGMIVCPGLIDVHVHFRDPGFIEKEDLKSGSQSALAGGFTTVVAMANTKPPVDSVKVLEEILTRAKKLPIHYIQTASVSKGLKGTELTDMEALYQQGAGGFTDDGIPLMDEKLLEAAMDFSARTGAPISLHEEDPAYISQPGINAGKTARELGYEGAQSKAEQVMVERDCKLALSTGAFVDIQHISSKEAVDLLRRAKAAGAHVSGEATPHHFTLTEEAVLQYGTLAKMNPPLRREDDRLEIIRGLKDGTIEMIATDHAPHTKEEKNLPFDQAPSGIIGLETALALGITMLVEPGHLTMMELLEKMTIAPARFYHLEQGRLQEGAPADLLIFDPQQKQIVDKFQSKADNSPFIGKKLKGTVKTVICKGKIHVITRNR